MRGGGFRGPFGGQDGTERFEQMLREMDTNRNGRVEESEVDGRRRFFVEMMARRAGIEPRFPMSISRLRDAMARQARENEDSSSERSRGSGGPNPDPLVPDFGVELDLPPVLKFGERAPDESSGEGNSRRPSRPGDSSARRGQVDERVRRGAEAMIRRADRNRNGRLERNEWNNQWGDFDQVDRDHRGAVDADELAQSLSNFARRGRGGDRSGPPGPGGSADGSGSEGGGSGSGDSERPTSYRMSTPTEGLPEGLPDWFARKDRNLDGQVAMAEFEPPGFWTDAAAAEFASYDLNGDGMMTAQECLTALGGSEGARAPTGSQVAQAARAAPPAAQGPPRGGPASLAPGARGPGGVGQASARRGPGLLTRGARGRGTFGQGRRQPERPTSAPRGGSGEAAGSENPWAGWE